MIEQRKQYELSHIVTSHILPEYGRCVLGEGLFVARDRISWVDIARNRLYVHDQAGNRCFLLPVTATLILASGERQLLVASINGIGSVNVFTGEYREITEFGDFACAETHRTNDGCVLSDGRCLVGTVHKTDPGANHGSVIVIDTDGTPCPLFDDIHIPNTFVEMENGGFLVTDSHTGTIFRYEFRKDAKLFRRSVWYQAQIGISPDGGCRLSASYIAIAMWDGACIGIFENSGVHVADILIPAKRPTNTKYCKDRKSLWITSAVEGLTQEDIEQYPLSGKTFMVYDPLDLVCS